MFMWVHAMLKVLAVTAENTADLYNSIFVAVFVDCGYIFFSSRSLSVLPGVAWIPIFRALRGTRDPLVSEEIRENNSFVFKLQP